MDHLQVFSPSNYDRLDLNNIAYSHRVGGNQKVSGYDQEIQRSITISHNTSKKMVPDACPWLGPP